MTVESWKRFYFESNHTWGYIKTHEEWKHLTERFYKNCTDRVFAPKAFSIFEAKQNIYDRNNDIPNFGFYKEHQGILTLRDYFFVHNIQSDLYPIVPRKSRIYIIDRSTVNS
jgi:hypothetical protein